MACLQRYNFTEPKEGDTPKVGYNWPIHIDTHNLEWMMGSTSPLRTIPYIFHTFGCHNNDNIECTYVSIFSFFFRTSARYTPIRDNKRWLCSIIIVINRPSVTIFLVSGHLPMYVCVCVCVCVREKERHRKRERERV